MNEELQQLKRELEELKAWKKSLETSYTIPLDVYQAFTSRFPSTPLSSSGKSASSENVTIDESGSATHTVMDNPDGFLQVQIGSTIYYLPYFS